MSRLLDAEPFGPRRDDILLDELNDLTDYHRRGCPPYARIWPGHERATRIEDVPFVHAGLFKRMELKTSGEGIEHQRILTSSSTSGSEPSRIALDAKSSALQSRSATAIHRAWIGGEPRPVAMLDSTRALRQPGALSARLAAGMSLRGLSTDIHFLLDDPNDAGSIRWPVLDELLEHPGDFIVYGSTWILWQAWAQQNFSNERLTRVKNRRIDFAHSGGWKKLEALNIGREKFESMLTERAGPGSRVVDYYGLAEQVGLLFPLCSEGRRHAPVWSDVLTRDPFALKSLDGEEGLLQFLNPLAWGAPYHSVLTEDIGRLRKNKCGCGRGGRTFELLRRVPKSEVRGCANI